MVKRATGWFGVALVCAVFGGCKSADDDAAPVSQNELPGAVANLVCDSLGACCSSAKLVFDSTNCHAAESALIRNKLRETLTPAVKYDAQAAGDCVAALKKDSVCGSTDNADAIPACERMFIGTLAEGQPCTNSAECAGQGSCTEDPTTFERVCRVLSAGNAAWIRGKLGDSCQGSCEDAASCSSTPVPGDVFVDPNAPAATPVACYYSDSLYCDGTCKKVKAIGEACATSNACEDGLFCDFDPGICAAPHPNGATCIGGFECQSHHCDVDSDTGSGTCVASSVTAEECANGML